MKAKHVFAITGLSLAMAATVLAGRAFASKDVRETSAVATPVTLYLDTNKLSWYGDQSRAYLYGGGGNNTWPGQALTFVSGSIYKLDIPDVSNYDSVIFLRSNGTDVWNRTSKDGGTAISLPANWATQNMWKFGDGWNGNEYDDGNYTGSWQLYTPPVVDPVYKASINGGTPVELIKNTTNPAEYCFDDDVALAAGDVLTFTVDDAAHAVTLSDSTLFYINNATVVSSAITVTKSATANIYWNVGTDKLWVGGQPSPEDGAVYLHGSFNGWSGVATKATVTGDVCVFEDLDLAANATVKAFVYDEDGADDDAKRVWVQPDEVSSDHPVDFPVGKDDENNAKVSVAGNYDLTVNKSTRAYSFVANDYVEPSFSLKVDNGTAIPMVKDESEKPEGVEHQYSATVEYGYRGRTLTFFRNDALISENIGPDVDGEQINNIRGNVTDGFKIYHGVSNMKVYLKTYSSGGYSIWGEGYAENDYYIMGGSLVGNSLVLDNTFEPHDGYIKQYKTNNAFSFAVKAAEAEKYYITDGGLYAMQALNMETAGENNAVAVTGSYFNVHNACSEVAYLKLKADMSLWLYIGGYEEAHVMTIGGQNITLHKANENEYYAEHVALSAGDTVTAYSIEGTPVTGFGAKVVGNNNLGKDLKVIVDVADASIYYNVNTKQIYISGLPLGGYHIIKNGTTLVEMTAAGEYEGFNQYKSELIEFAKDDTIKFVDTNGAEGVKSAVIFSITKINTEGLGSKFKAVDGVVKAKEAVEAKVYLKLKAGLDEIYFGEVDPYIVDAKEFVDGFKSALAGACSAEGKKAAVEAAWALQATAFAALEKEAQDEIKLGHLSSVNEIKEFADRYIWFIEESGYTLTNFLDWDLNPAQLGVSIDSNNTAMLFAVIGAVSLITLASVIVLKKKKANR